MTRRRTRWRFIPTLLLVSLGTACAAIPSGPGSVRFTRKMLVLDPNEGCAVADVDRDGDLDVIAGRHWYAAPEFIPRPVRLLEEWESYLRSNGEFALDVDGDGWVDVVSGSWMQGEVWWYRNPGAEDLARGRLWDPRLLKDTGVVHNEAAFLRDLDGDGAPEWVVNSWIKDAPFLAWKLARDASGRPTLEKAVIGVKGNGHGIGFGDLNGDGREDILVGQGWYERPVGDPFARPWTFHPDWSLHASCPMIVADVNSDGRNDILWGKAHEYGLFWLEQLPPGPDGKPRWKEHLIDRSWSQPHVLEWADLDGDGRPELIAGKRVRAHDKGDPGNTDPPCLYYYTVHRSGGTFTRHVIDEGGAGVGMQIRVADLNGDGRPDLVTPGKSGTYLFFNQGLPRPPRR